MKKVKIFLLIIFLLSIPTFFRMVRPGIYSMQDFHYFRLFEFDKCIKALQIPCRWAPDAGLSYGEPLFNFYTQIPYHLVGLQLVDSLKITFILSLVLSGVTMFLLSRKLWKSDLAGLVSAVLYIYAPYRAVDVWVRGALPEAFSFIFFPLVILFFEKIIEGKSKRNYLWFSLSLSLTLLNHNLSLILFAPFLVIWIIYRIIEFRKWKIIPGLTISVLGSLLLSSFYILPVVFESKYIDLESTTKGYFDFRAHFDTIYQTLFSRFWGYGGSTWGPEDGLNLSVGLLQWMLPILLIVLSFLTKKKTVWRNLLVITAVGWFCLFMTHNKSAFLWEAIKPLRFMQFPWRFLGQAVFAFSLSVGAIPLIFNKSKAVMVSFLVIILVIALTITFFREDIWYNYTDSILTTGKIFEEQTRASIGDYWPQFGHKIPDKPSDGKYINYFPGWNYTPDKNGLITSEGAIFTDTPVRRIGNVVSLVSLVGLLFLYFKFKNEK